MTTPAIRPRGERPRMTPPDSTAKPPVRNLANALTLLRVACVPVLLVLLIPAQQVGAPMSWILRIVAMVVFVAASITDLVDGRIARSRGLETDFGRIADPIADKALIGAALVYLSAVGEVPWWITAVIMVREVGVTVVRLLIVRRRVVPAGSWGKTKTVVQVVAVSMLLVGPVPGAWAMPPDVVTLWWGLCWVALALALVLTVATGVQILVQIARAPKGTA